MAGAASASSSDNVPLLLLSVAILMIRTRKKTARAPSGRPAPSLHSGGMSLLVGIDEKIREQVRDDQGGGRNRHGAFPYQVLYSGQRCSPDLSKSNIHKRSNSVSITRYLVPQCKVRVSKPWGLLGVLVLRHRLTSL